MTQDPTLGTGADQAPQLTTDFRVSSGTRSTRHTSTPPTVVPTMGWQKWAYMALHVLSLPYPGPGKKEIQHLESLRVQADQKAEQEANAAQVDSDLQLYVTMLEDEIRRTNQQRRWAAVVSNVKGGAGKTPVSCNLASVTGAVTMRVTTVVDNNPNWGTTAYLLGISPDQTMSVRQLFEAIQEGKADTFGTFSGSLGATKHATQLVASDKLTRRDASYGHEVAKRVIEATKTNSIFVVNDTGNSIADEAMQAALELSDVLIVPALTTHAKLEGATTTMQNYHSWGHQNMVKHAVVVVNGLLPGESAEDYRDKLELEPDQILIGIPFDERIHKDLVVDIELLRLYTYIAYLELVLVVSKVAKYTQQHGRNGPPLKIVQGELVTLPSGRTPVLPYVKRVGMEPTQKESTL